MTKILGIMMFFMLIGLMIMYHIAKRKLYEAEREEQVRDCKNEQQLDYKNQFYLKKIEFEKDMRALFHGTKYIDCVAEKEKFINYIKEMHASYKIIDLPEMKDTIGNELVKMTEDFNAIKPCFDVNRFPLSDVLSLQNYGCINKDFLDREKMLTTTFCVRRLDDMEKQINLAIEQKNYQRLCKDFPVSELKEMLWFLARGTVGTKMDYKRAQKLFLRVHKQVHIDVVTSELCMAWNTDSKAFVRNKVLKLIGSKACKTKEEYFEKTIFEKNAKIYYKLLASALNAMNADECEKMVLRYMNEQKISMSDEEVRRVPMEANINSHYVKKKHRPYKKMGGMYTDRIHIANFVYLSQPCDVYIKDCGDSWEINAGTITGSRESWGRYKNIKKSSLINMNYKDFEKNCRGICEMVGSETMKQIFSRIKSERLGNSTQNGMNSDITENQDKLPDWIVFLDAKVESGCCWEVSYFAKKRNQYNLIHFGSTYGGSGRGNALSVAGREAKIEELEHYSWSLSVKQRQKIISDCKKSIKNGKPPKGYLILSEYEAYRDFFGDIEYIQGELGEAIRKIVKR